VPWRGRIARVIESTAPNGMPSIRKMRISLDDLAHKHSQELTRSFPISTYYAATWFSQLMPQS